MKEKLSRQLLLRKSLGLNIRKKWEILRASVDTLDWIILGILSFFCFVCYQHEDIRITGGNSFGYLNGHFLDIYDYNSTRVGGMNYLPTTYLLFALWNIPIRLFGLVEEPTVYVGAFVRMWYKLGTFLLFLATAYLIYKICLKQAVAQKQAVIVAFLFLSNPIAIYSELIFGQYDIITTFFMCLGLYYYFQEDRKKFVLAFAVALTCKYFALLVFVPLLLLREKNVWKILRDMAAVSSLFIIETLFSISSQIFQTGIFEFSATGYIYQVSLSYGTISVSLVVVLWVLLCAFAYFKEWQEHEWFAWSIYLCCGVMFLSFGLAPWHPQWLLMAVPFLTLGMAFQKKTDIYLLMDLLMYIVFIYVVIHTCREWCDQNLFDGGIFRRFVVGIVGKNLAMADIMVFQNLNLIYSAFVAVLLAYVVFLHPKRMCKAEHVCSEMSKGILRLRYIGGCCFFIIPSLICLVYNLTFPRITFASEKEVEKIVGPMKEDDVYEQVFIAQGKCVTGIAVKFGTYIQKNNSVLRCELIDHKSGQVLNERKIETAKLEDNEFVTFDFLDKTSVLEGKRYRIRIRTESMRKNDKFTIYRTDLKLDDDDDKSSYSLINGRKISFDLGIKVYGK